jgi:hypothetical protein
MGVKPIIDSDVETELIFGEQMVIGDTFEKHAEARICTNWRHNAGTYYDGTTYDYYYCNDMSDHSFDVSTVPGWNDKTISEKSSYAPTEEDFNCILFNWSLPDGVVPEEGHCYVQQDTYQQWTAFHGGACSGYKLKLTNFAASNCNYIGWYAFKDSTLNDANTSVVINGNSLLGGEIFAGTNVKNVTIKTNNYGDGLFKSCQGLEKISIDSNVTYLKPETFAKTNLTSFDFSNYNIKHIGARAFENAQITSVDFTGIEQIDYRAFKDNDIINLSLPKSIKRLGAEIFKGNGNMKKVTIAYDTMTKGTVIP